MKKFSKKQLIEQAAGIFKKHPKASFLYATTDGQYFLSRNRAELHASSDKLSVVIIQVTDIEEEEIITIKKLKPIVANLSDISQLEELLASEKASEDPRKTAIKLIEERIEELIQNLENFKNESNSPEMRNEKIENVEPE